MQKILSLTLGAVLSLPLFTGCAAVDPGADPLVVHAERTASYALDTFDAFLKYEFENRALIGDPAVKKAADGIRRDAPGWIADLRAATRAYKATRSTADGDRLQLALTVVQTALEVARKYMAPKPPSTGYQFVPYINLNRKALA